MKLIKPSFEIRFITPGPTKLIEKEARRCYKTEGAITEDSHLKFCKKLINRGHFAMIEFADVAVSFVANRGFSHEVVRHRLTSLAQESTRYCDYSDDQKHDGELHICEPHYFTKDYWAEKVGTTNALEILNVWVMAMSSAESSYKYLRHLGVPAQLARDVLPIGVKTEIGVKANFREWRHIFKMRYPDTAHPIMHELMRPLLSEFKKKIPIIFDDLFCE